jgi:glutamyl-tRNA synthetase
MSVVTRFPPSPTGALHIGGARTALFSWLFARHSKGKFVFRLEDTDRARSSEAHVESIVRAMTWLGLDYDEGPFYQTKRFERYDEVIKQLLDSGKAYRCYCSRERLDQLRETQIAAKVKARYDGHCRDVSDEKDGDYVVRFKNPTDGAVEFDDVIRGKITVNNAELDDLIIARSDGTPTYHLTVVVDDWDMGVTHVIRGDDHINNTPRQINLLKALDAPLPIYGHTTMILGEDGKRLSKRHGAVDVIAYRDAGFLPAALLNYLVRLGWSHGDQEVFSVDDMIANFDLTHLNNSPATFNLEKLTWLNQYYLKTLSTDAILSELQWHIAAMGFDIQNGPDIHAVIDAYRERVKTLKELAEACRFLYVDEVSYDEKAKNKVLKPEAKPALEAALKAYELLPSWTEDAVHAVILATAEHLDLKMGKVAQPIRVAITGNTMSPPMGITLLLLGRARTLKRLGDVISQL